MRKGVFRLSGYNIISPDRARIGDLLKFTPMPLLKDGKPLRSRIIRLGTNVRVVPLQPRFYTILEISENGRLALVEKEGEKVWTELFHANVTIGRKIEE